MAAAAAILLALGASVAMAQTPPYQGALLIQPGSLASKCLQADNADSAKVVIADCTGADSQKWTFTGGAIKIYGSKCLDVTNGANNDGTKLQIYDCGNNNPNQQWYYTGDNHLAWTNHGKCLDLTGGSFANGNQLQIWTCGGSNTNQVWDVGYMYNQQPNKSERDQTGTNQCGTGSSQSSQCQTLWINDANDFCLWGPPSPGTAIGVSEQYEVAWCTKAGHGTRVMPAGTLKGVHFVKTKDYVQVTGAGDFTKINILRNDPNGGGELDPHGADGRGNPIGGLVYGNSFSPNLQYHEWTNFMDDKEFCIRACTGPNARENCQHIYDVMGCYWNMPANYDSGKFESCLGDNDLPMGVYGTSTWYQGQNPTPPAHPVAPSSQCTTYATIPTNAAKRDLHKLAKRHAMATPAPMF